MAFSPVGLIWRLLAGAVLRVSLAQNDRGPNGAAICIYDFQWLARPRIDQIHSYGALHVRVRDAADRRVVTASRGPAQSARDVFQLFSNRCR
jgi:hypothetical protein